MFTGIVREVGSVVAVEGGDGRRRARGRGAGHRAGDRRRRLGRDRRRLPHGRVRRRRPPAASTPFPRRCAGSTLGGLTQGRASTSSRRCAPASRSAATTSRATSTGSARCRSVEAEGDGLRVVVDAPAELLRYCVEKGSITVDGVSLTVAELDDDAFAVALIPHTLAVTTLGDARARAARSTSRSTCSRSTSSGCSPGLSRSVATIAPWPRSQ